MSTPRNKQYLGGIDIGTTGCKITIYDEDGNFCYRSYRDYPVSRAVGEHEVDAAAIWDGVKAVVQDGAARYPDIAAIGVTSFGESCVLLDEEDQPIRPVMLYTDARGSAECEELVQKLGAEPIAEITGIAPHSMYSLPKIMWIKKHCPQEYGRVRHILMMEDYIIYMLTGNAVIDYSLASRSMAFDIRKLQWSEAIFQAAGIESCLFSEPVRSGTAAGTLKEEMACLLGLSGNTLILPVGHDQVAAAIGTGVFSEEVAVDGAGTVECITPVFAGIPEGTAMRENNYAVVPYVVPGKYVTYAFSYTGGALLEWFIKTMAKEEKRLGKEQGSSVYEILERGMKEEPTGILVLPHFAGAATPYMDTGSKGAIVGLTVEHTISDLYRAMMEGVVYEMMLNLERLQKAAVSPRMLRAAGGGAASGVWMQMKADMLNLPIVSLGNAEAGAAGCVMLAGIAAGIFDSLESASAKVIREKAVYQPRPAMHEAYQKLYARYRKLYEAVRPLV